MKQTMHRGSVAVFLLFTLAITSGLVHFKPNMVVRNQGFDSLDPASPQSYLMLGERLAADAQTQQELALASRVLATGLGLAHRQEETSLAASLCIALADIEPDDQVYADLWDLALLIDPDRLSAWSIYRNARQSQSQNLDQQASACLYAVRYHDHKIASELWGSPQVRKRIERAATASGHDPTQISRAIGRLIDLASSDDCRGRVFVTRRGDGEIQRVVCPDHRRPLGTFQSDHDFQRFLEIELHLLGQMQTLNGSTSWAISEYFEASAPARDPSLGEILNRYNADLARPIYKSGRWASSP